MARELYVGHLSELVTEEEVWKLFSVMGTVTSVHLIFDPESGEFKRCGYVRMAAGVNLEEVAESLDGTYLVDKLITVSIARPQKPGMSTRKTAGSKPWLKPWMKPGPKPAKSGAKPGEKSAAERKPKTRTAAAPAEGPKTVVREQRPKARTSSPASAGPARGKRPGTGPRTPRAGK
jgi:RNA recognition motif-containing protein